jgi:hypothetical protein
MTQDAISWSRSLCSAKENKISRSTYLLANNVRLLANSWDCHMGPPMHACVCDCVLIILNFNAQLSPCWSDFGGIQLASMIGSFFLRLSIAYLHRPASKCPFMWGGVSSLSFVWACCVIDVGCVLIVLYPNSVWMWLLYFFESWSVGFPTVFIY